MTEHTTVWERLLVSGVILCIMADPVLALFLAGYTSNMEWLYLVIPSLLFVLI